MISMLLGITNFESNDLTLYLKMMSKERSMWIYTLKNSTKKMSDRLLNFAEFFNHINLQNEMKEEIESVSSESKRNSLLQREKLKELQNIEKVNYSKDLSSPSLSDASISSFWSEESQK